MQDINSNDLMKFGPTMKMMNEKLISYMEKHVAGSKGTALYLRVMKQMYEAYTDTEMEPIERIFTIW